MTHLLYVGTYTDKRLAAGGKAEGIFIYTFDPTSGALSQHSAVDGVLNPSFLAFSKDQRLLFSVNELGEFAGVEGGGASAFRVNPQTGQPTLINSQPTHGATPCYITVDPSGKWVLVANYNGGSLTVFPLNGDGSLGAAAFVLQQQGHSIHLPDQTMPHLHSAMFTPDGRFVVAADLGVDQVLILRLDEQTGELIRHATTTTEPGAGPRHPAFSADSRFLYISTELSSTVAVFAYDAQQGTLQHLQTISMLPADYTGRKWAADIHIAPSGRFLYASNREHDSIAVFAIDTATGLLTLVEIVPSGGKTPRNFTLAGRFLIVAHQDSESLVTFEADSATGRLTQIGQPLSIPSPVFVKVVEI